MKTRYNSKVEKQMEKIEQQLRNEKRTTRLLQLQVQSLTDKLTTLSKNQNKTINLLNIFRKKYFWRDPATGKPTYINIEEIDTYAIDKLNEKEITKYLQTVNLYYNTIINNEDGKEKPQSTPTKL